MMPAPIARTYSSHEAATAAAHELEASRVSHERVHVVAPPASGDSGAQATPGGNDPVLASVLKTGISPSGASVYADAVRRGDSLVVVHPLLGRSIAATSVLRSHGPTDVAAPEPDQGDVEVSRPVDESERVAAPFSTLLGWPVLLSDSTPLSSYLKWPVLKREPRSSRTLNAVRQQSGDAAPLSKRIGLPPLSANAAPLSGALRLTVSSETAAPLSSRFGWRVLLRDPTPLSTALGWKVLLKRKRRPARHVRYL